MNHVHSVTKCFCPSMTSTGILKLYMGVSNSYSFVRSITTEPVLGVSSRSITNLPVQSLLTENGKKLEI